ncbi:hypothetical protein BUALT_Bualt03G0075200 [Buddleja alternifolia]|uniref:SHSP domain-containing protein n=1 Tax=Buddleja alternifolia TaxID=168488 RepID=A0AAV6XYM1_9LAMI|nr:hypothetical protein BUALT_Bualt03G0075200 [Buddleja alternifolia]
MEVSSRNYFFPSAHLFPYRFVPENSANWIETPESHIYSTHIPGVRKEEIILEVEDSRYLIIRTEVAGDSTAEHCVSFNRKLRLPRQANIDGISAAYVDGVFTVTVPRTFAKSRGFFIDPADRPEKPTLLARAA